MIQKFKEFLNHNNGFLGATYNFLKLKKYQLRNYKIHNYRFENNNKQINQIVKDLNKNGYHVIKNFISENDCKELTKIINDFIQNRKELIWVDEEGSDERISTADFLASINIWASLDRSAILRSSIPLCLVPIRSPAPLSFKSTSAN